MNKLVFSNPDKKITIESKVPLNEEEVLKAFQLLNIDGAISPEADKAITQAFEETFEATKDELDAFEGGYRSRLDLKEGKYTQEFEKEFKDLSDVVKEEEEDFDEIEDPEVLKHLSLERAIDHGKEGKLTKVKIKVDCPSCSYFGEGVSFLGNTFSKCPQCRIPLFNEYATGTEGEKDVNGVTYICQQEMVFRSTR